MRKKLFNKKKRTKKQRSFKNSEFAMTDADIELMIGNLRAHPSGHKREEALLLNLEKALLVIRLNEILGADSILFKVKYDSLLGWLDNLTRENEYPVLKVNKKDNTYTIINDCWEKKDYSTHKFVKTK